MTQPAPQMPESSQHYAPQPQYGAQPQYDLQSSTQMQAAAERPGRVLAMIAVAFAALYLLTKPIQAFITANIIASGAAPTMVGFVSSAAAIVGFALSMGAIGFGIASLVRRERARVLAGAAIGVGVSGLIGLLSAGIQTLVYATL